MDASHPGHPISGAPTPHAHRALTLRRVPLEPRSARRFSIALACLGLSYALAWLELPLGQIAPAPADSAAPAAATLAAALVARVLLGLLYAFVALRHAWARWTTVALCLVSAAFVAPMLPLEWRAFPLGALVTGAGLAAKLLAGSLLMLPLRRQRDTRS